MKIRLVAKEIIYHDVSIDTLEYGHDGKDVFQVVEIINNMKEDIRGFIKQGYDNSLGELRSEFELTSISEDK